jgi:hypothetical protein
MIATITAVRAQKQDDQHTFPKFAVRVSDFYRITFGVHNGILIRTSEPSPVPGSLWIRLYQAASTELIGNGKHFYAGI